MVRNKQKWLSFMMSVVMLLTSGISNVTAFGAEDIMPFNIIDIYSNEELKHDNPPTRQPVLTNPNYSTADGGSLVPDIVSWTKPGTGQKYMAYCIDPGLKGWETSDQYRIEIHTIMTLVLVFAFSSVTVFAADDIWTVAEKLIKDIYAGIVGISTILAGLMSAISVIGAKMSNNQHKVDQAWDWLKRIWVAWAVINGIGAFIAFVAPLFKDYSTLTPV